MRVEKSGGDRGDTITRNLRLVHNLKLGQKQQDELEAVTPPSGTEQIRQTIVEPVSPCGRSLQKCAGSLPMVSAIVQTLNGVLDPIVYLTRVKKEQL